MSSKIVRGTFILTLASVISKILGILYVIPFHRLVGTLGQTLYYYSYVPYMIFIMISTAGFPQGVAKMTASYDTLEEHELKEYLFRVGRLVMMVLGIAAFVVLYFGAELVARQFDSDEYTISEIAQVIRSVSTALIVIPLLSFLRGYLQGHGRMGPTAISQVVEQVVRVIMLLVGTYLFIDQGIVRAIYMATFASFGSALVALLIMLYYSNNLRKQMPTKIIIENTEAKKVQIYSMFKELGKSSIPFLFVSLALPLFSMIDSVSVNRILLYSNQVRVADIFLTVYNVQVQQLIMIPMAVATAMQVSILPTISATMALKDMVLLRRQLNETFLLLLFFIIPASFGISFLGRELYTLFYESSDLGTLVLRLAAPTIILFSLFTVSASVLQGMGARREVIRNLLIGILIKFVGNIVLIWFLGPLGTILSTALGFSTVAGLNVRDICKKSSFSMKPLLRKVGLIFILTAIMSLVLVLILWVMSFWLSNTRTIDGIIIIAICTPIGIAIYLYLSYRTDLMALALGKRSEVIMNKLLFRKK